MLRYHPLNLQVRIAFFYTMGQFSGAFGGLLAYAIHYMDGAGGLSSWRWIFIIEGLCTVVLAVALYFVLPNRVDDCKWLSSDEKTAIWERKSAGTAADPLARKFEWHYLTECLKGEWHVET
jgi:MFS family permease